MVVPSKVRAGEWLLVLRCGSQIVGRPDRTEAAAGFAAVSSPRRRDSSLRRSLPCRLYPGADAAREPVFSVRAGAPPGADAGGLGPARRCRSVRRPSSSAQRSGHRTTFDERQAKRELKREHERDAAARNWAQQRRLHLERRFDAARSSSDDPPRVAAAAAAPMQVVAEAAKATARAAERRHREAAERRAARDLRRAAAAQQAQAMVDACLAHRKEVGEAKATARAAEHQYRCQRREFLASRKLAVRFSPTPFPCCPATSTHALQCHIHHSTDRSPSFPHYPLSGVAGR